MAECNIVEIIKDGQPVEPGKIGEVVITSLNNYEMPLIRYSIGDLAVQLDDSAPCSCGQGLPKIGTIQGRTQATIIGTKNQYLPGSFFARLFADSSVTIKHFQVIQNNFGEIDLNIVKASLYNDEALQKILTIIRRFLGEDLKINVHFVDKIALGKTGKMQHSISNLELDFDKAEFVGEKNNDQK